MNNVLTLLFFTTFLHACVNGGALRGQEGIGYPISTFGVWPGTAGYAGVPGVSGSPENKPGLALGYASAGYVGAQGSWTRPVAHPGASGGLSGSEYSSYLTGPRAGSWSSPSRYIGEQEGTGCLSRLNGYPGVPGSSRAPVSYAEPTAVPKILPGGSIADVPEVAAARAAHLSAVQVAASDPRLSDADDGEYNPYKYGDHLYFQHDQHSIRHVGYNDNGMIVNGKSTKQANIFVDEVAKTAKKYAEEQWDVSIPRGNFYANAEIELSQLISKNAVAAVSSSHTSGELVRPYTGPLATPQVLPSGYVADTIEVNEARQKHLRALAVAEASAAKWEEKKSGWN